MFRLIYLFILLCFIGCIDNHNNVNTTILELDNLPTAKIIQIVEVERYPPKLGSTTAYLLEDIKNNKQFWATNGYKLDVKINEIYKYTPNGFCEIYIDKQIIDTYRLHHGK